MKDQALVAFLLLVAMPGAPSSVLAPSSVKDQKGVLAHLDSALGALLALLRSSRRAYVGFSDV